MKTFASIRKFTTLYFDTIRTLAKSELQIKIFQLKIIIFFNLE